MFWLIRRPIEFLLDWVGAVHPWGPLGPPDCGPPLPIGRGAADLRPTAGKSKGTGPDHGPDPSPGVEQAINRHRRRGAEPHARRSPADPGGGGGAAQT